MSKKRTITKINPTQLEEGELLRKKLENRSIDVDRMKSGSYMKSVNEGDNQDQDAEDKIKDSKESVFSLSNLGESVADAAIETAAGFIGGPIAQNIASNFGGGLANLKAAASNTIDSITDAVAGYANGKTSVQQSDNSMQIAPSMQAIDQVSELMKNGDPAFKDALEYQYNKDNGTLSDYLYRYASTSGKAMGIDPVTHLPVDLTEVIPSEVETSIRQYAPLIEAYKRAKSVSDGLAVANHDVFGKNKTGLSEFDILKSPDKAKPEEYINTTYGGTNISVKNPNYKKELDEWNKIQSENLPSINDLYEQPDNDYTQDQRVLARKKVLGDRFNSNMSSIKYNQEYTKSLLEQHPLSEKFKKNKESEDNLTRWMYNLPSQIGYSSTDIKRQTAQQVTSSAAGIVASNLPGYWKLAGYGALFLGNMAASLAMRKGETAMELSEYGSSKSDYYMENETGSKPLSKRSDVELLGAIDTNKADKDVLYALNDEIKKNGSLSNDTRSNLIAGLEAGMVPTTDKNVSNSVLHRLKGLDEYKAQSEAFSYPEAAVDAAVSTFTFGNKAVGKVAGYGMKKLEGTLLGAVAGRALQAGEQFVEGAASRVTEGALYKVAKMPAVATVRNVLATGIEEGFEEAGQFGLGVGYVKDLNQKNDSYFGSIVSGLETGASGIYNLLGTNGDARFTDKKELIENAASGFIMGIAHPTSMAIKSIHGVNALKDKLKSEEAQEFIKGNLNEILDINSRTNKAGIYLDQALKGNGDKVLDVIQDKINQGGSDGKTRQFWEEELIIAKQAIRHADSNETNTVLKGNGWSKGSKEHAAFVGLISDFERTRRASLDEMYESEKGFNSTIEKDHDSDVQFKAYISTLNESRDDDKKVTESQSKELYKALAMANSAISSAEKKNLMNSIFEAISNTAKEDNDEATANSVKSGLNSDKNKTTTEAFKRIALRHISYAKDVLEQIGLSLDDIKNIPVNISEDSKKHSIKSIAAEAGFMYENKLLNELYGYKIGKNSKGESALVKMEDSEYARKVKGRVDSFINSIEKENEREDAAVIKAQNIAKTDSKVDETPVAEPTPLKVEEVVPQETPTQQKPVSVTEPIVDNSVSDTTQEVTPEVTNEDISYDEGHIEDDGNLDSGRSIYDEAVNQGLFSDSHEPAHTEEHIQSVAEDDESDAKILEATKGSIDEIESGNPMAPGAPASKSSVVMDPTPEIGPFSDEDWSYATWLSYSKVYNPEMNEFANDISANGLSGYSVELNLSPFEYRNGQKSISIKVVFTNSKTGKKYTTYVKDIYHSAGNNVGELAFSGGRLNALREFRRQIITQYNNNPTGSILKPENLTLSPTRGIKNLRDKNNNPVYRPIANIAGFSIPKNKNGVPLWNLVGVHTLDFRYNINKTKPNAGIIKTYTPITKNTDRSVDRSIIESAGSIFIIVKNPTTGNETPIKVERAKLNPTDSDSNAIVDLVYDLMINQLASEETPIRFNKNGISNDPVNSYESGVSVFDLLSFIFNTNNKVSEKTKAALESKGDEESLGFLEELVNKQFYVFKQDKDGNARYFVQIGEKAHPIDVIKSDLSYAAIVKKHISDNIKWNFTKDLIVSTKDNKIVDLTIGELFPGINKAFADGKVDKVSFAKGFEFSKEDMNLSAIAWMLKNGNIQSDVVDGIFDTPFIRIEGIQQTEPETPVLVNGNEYTNTEDTSSDIEAKKVDIEKRRKASIQKINKTSKEIAYTGIYYPPGFYQNIYGTFTNLNPKDNGKTKIAPDAEYIRGSLKDVTNKINAKYDAELAALEDTTTKEKESELTQDELLNILSTAETISSEASIIEETPTELDDLDNLRSDAKSRSRGDFAAFHTASMDKSTRINEAKSNDSKIWLMNTLGLDESEIDIFDEVVSLGHDSVVMGMMTESAIKLWNRAEKGTEYHEAFHRVSLLLLSNEERSKIYSAVRKSYKSFENASDKEIEEFLADSFRDYVIDRDATDKLPVIRRMFRKIYNFIKSIFGLKPRDIDRLYSDIVNGRYKGVKPNQESLDRFRKEYGGEAQKVFSSYGFKNIKSIKDLNNIISNLVFDELFHAGALDTGSISNIRMYEIHKSIIYSWHEAKGTPMEDFWHELDMSFDEKLKPFIKKFLEDLSISEKTIDDNNSDESDSVGDEIKSHIVESFKYSKKANLSMKMKLFLMSVPKLTIKDNTPIPLTDERGMPLYEDYNKVFNALLQKLAGVEYKDMLSVIHEEAKKNPIFLVIERRLVNKATEEFRTQFLKVFNNHDHNFMNAAYSESDKEERGTSFRFETATKEKAIFTLPKKWSVQLYMSEMIYPTNKEGYKEFNPEALSKIIRLWESGPIKDVLREAGKGNTTNIVTKVNGWSEPFEVGGKTLYKLTGDDVVINLSTIEGRKIVLKELTRQLSLIGIDVDVDTLEYLTEDSILPDSESCEKLINYIERGIDGKGLLLLFDIVESLIPNNGQYVKEIRGKSYPQDISTIFRNERVVTTLAEAYAETHPDMEEIMITGPDGAAMYPISLNSAITDKAVSLSNDKEELIKAINATYASGEPDDLVKLIPEVQKAVDEGVITAPTGSIILQQLATGKSKGIKLSTFNKMYKDNSSDKGRNFAGLSFAEDFVMKASALANDLLVLPTMADKTTYMFLSGISLPHEKIGYTVNANGVASIKFGPKTLEIMSNYFKAELKAIEEAIQHYKDANGDKLLLIDKYHYDGVDLGSGEKLPFGQGNGMRFRHFGDLKCMFDYTGGQLSEPIYLNDMLNNAAKEDPSKHIENLERAVKTIRAKLIDNRADGSENQALKLTINHSLEETLLHQELPYAESLGVVTMPKGKFLYLANKLLDRTKTRLLEAEYNGSPFAKIEGGDGKLVYKHKEHSAIFHQLADNMVNSIISTIEFEKIFSKDPAFHKDPDAKIKRLSPYLSTGDNMRLNWPTGHRLNGVTTFESIELKDNEVDSKIREALKGMFFASEVNRLIEETNKQLPANEQKKTRYGLREYLAKNTGGVLDLESDVMKNFKENYPKEFKAALASAEGYANAYKKNNETDATVYVSPSMYRNILEMLGEWDPSMNEAFDILESEDQSWMDDDKKWKIVSRLVMQPLKTIYVGEEFDMQRKLNAPKIDKMAMYPLFRVFANGDLSSMYERMYPKDPLVKPVDMFAFDSAVKVNNANPTKYKTDDSITDISKIASITQEYKYLRRQLLTDPHEVHAMNLGTQMVKGAMSNIVPDRTYDNIVIDGKRGATGKTLANEYSKAIVALSNIGKKSVFDEFSTTDENTGAKKLNLDKLYETLVDNAMSSNLDSGLIDALNQYKKGNFIPLQALSASRLLESKILSIIGDKIIDIDMPGGMFIQMTPFGIGTINKNKMSQAEYEAIYGDKYMINNGNDLRLEIVGGPNDGSMECAVSINLFSDLIPDHLKHNFVEARQWLIDNDLIGPNASKSSIGYRIPTQGLSSISSLVVADVLPSFIGDTIILPTEFTTQTGSDFDIDKLYLSRYNYKVENVYESSIEYSNSFEDRFQNSPNVKKKREVFGEEFDEDRAKVEWANMISKENNIKLFYNIEDARWYTGNVSRNVSKIEMNDSVEDKWNNNSKEAIQNRLLDIFHAVLTDKSNMHERKSTLDSVTKDKLKDTVLKEISELSEPEESRYAFKYGSPKYQSEKKIFYTTGKNGIAPMALANAHHVLAQLSSLEFRDLAKLQQSSIKSLHDIYGRDGVRILDWLSAMINAHVDVAKDPYILRLNVNPFTYSMTAMLLRSGIGDSTFWFLSQPAIKELAFKMNAAKGEYGVDKTLSNTNMIKYAYEKIRAEYMAKAKELAKGNKANTDTISALNNTNENKERISINKDVFDKNRLKKGIDYQNKDFDYYAMNIEALDKFMILSPAANSLSSLVKYSQVDTKKYGTSIAGLELFMSNVTDFIKQDGQQGYFQNATKLLKETFIYDKLHNAIDVAKLLTDDMFFRTTEYGEAFNKLIYNILGKYNVNTEDKLNSIMRVVDTYYKTDFFMNRAAEWNITDFKGLFYGPNSVAKELFRLSQLAKSGDEKYLSIQGNTLLNAAIPVVAMESQDSSTRKPDTISINHSMISDNQVLDEVSGSLSELIHSSIPEVSLFAKRLIVQQFMQSGDNGGFNIIKMAEDDREFIGIHDYIKKELESLKMSDSNIHEKLDNMFENNWWNNAIVQELEFSTMKTIEDPDGFKEVPVHLPSIAANKSFFSSNVAIPIIIVGESEMQTGKSSFGYPIYKPYVKVQAPMVNGERQWTLYKFVGVTVVDRKTDKEGKEIIKYQPVYVAQNKKGVRSPGRNFSEFQDGNSFVPTNIVWDGANYLGLDSNNAVNRFTESKDLFYNFANAMYMDNQNNFKKNKNPMGFETTRMHEYAKEFIPVSITDEVNWMAYNGSLIGNYEWDYEKQWSYDVDTEKNDTIQNRILSLENEIKELKDIDNEIINNNPDIIIAKNMVKITPESARKETGVKTGTSKDININLLSKDGVSVSKAAEIIFGDYFNEDSQHPGIDDQYIRNVIIDILKIGKNKFIESYLNTDRIKQKEIELNSIKDKLSKTEQIESTETTEQTETQQDELSSDSMLDLFSNAKSYDVTEEPIQSSIEFPLNENDVAMFNEYMQIINDPSFELNKSKLNYLESKGLTQESLKELTPTAENMGILLKLLC